jgi:hypothetical protein
MTVVCERCRTTNFERSSVCAGCGLGLRAIDPVVDGRNTAAPTLRIRRKWLTWKGGLLFLVVWALLVGEILLYGGRVPKTPEGWAALVFVGPIGYVALAGVLDWIFGSANTSAKVHDDRPAA